MSPRVRATVLLIAVIGTTLGILAEFGGWASNSPGSIYRIGAYGAIGLTAIYELARHRRIEVVAAMSALAFCVLSLTEAGELTGFDSGNTLACLILISVVYAATRESRTAGPIVLGATLTAVYTVVSVIVERPPASEAIARLMIGIPGQALVMWITWQLMQSLAEASEHEARTARLQKALATCSQALLSGRDDEPLDAALEALLDATEADHVFVDMNRVGEDGQITTQVVAEAVGQDIAPGADTSGARDYSHIPMAIARLTAGTPARVQVSELPTPLRARFEGQGVQSWLMAPVMTRGQWVGTLGYSDFRRDNAWTEAEMDGLMRAADMVGAYWERETARDGLEKLAEAKDRFIATVSHELRTPLAAVVGFAGELSQSLDRYSRDEVLEMVTLISNQSIEVAQLVDDLLTAERAASGNLTMTPTTIDLVDETRSIVDSLGLEVTVEGEPVATWADTLRTRQIVRNLLTNAHRHGGPRIRVEVSAEDGVAMLAVTDDGQGVRSIDVERIFDPYYRAESEHSKPESVGLGLAVARQLARLMGGDLVYRRRSGWTRFELTLPVAAHPTPALIR